MTALYCDIQGAQESAKILRELEREFPHLLDKALESHALAVKKRAKRILWFEIYRQPKPKYYRRTKRLYRSIMHMPITHILPREFMVYSEVVYAIFIEKGFKGFKGIYFFARAIEEKKDACAKAAKKLLQWWLAKFPR